MPLLSTLQIHSDEEAWEVVEQLTDSYNNLYKSTDNFFYFNSGPDGAPPPMNMKGSSRNRLHFVDKMVILSAVLFSFLVNVRNVITFKFRPYSRMGRECGDKYIIRSHRFVVRRIYEAFQVL